VWRSLLTPSPDIRLRAYTESIYLSAGYHMLADYCLHTSSYLPTTYTSTGYLHSRRLPVRNILD